MRGGNLIAYSRWMALFLLVALWLAYLPSTATAAEATTVSITTAGLPLEAGDQLSVSIEVVPGTAIAGMQFDLAFDASLFAVSTVQEGDLLSQDGTASFFNSGSIDNQGGEITGVFGAITTPGMTVSTAGTFATVVFTARQASENCPLTLSNVIVGDGEGKAVPVSLDNEGSPSETVQTPVFRWWVLSVIVGTAVLLIAATVTGVLLRRRQVMKTLEASQGRH